MIPPKERCFLEAGPYRNTDWSIYAAGLAECLRRQYFFRGHYVTT